MSQIEIKIADAQGAVKASVCGNDEAVLVYKAAYEEGDRIIVETEKSHTFYWMQVDEAVGKSMVYITGTVEYQIPFGEQKLNLSPKAFEGELHLLSVRKAKAFEYAGARNLSLNVSDQHGAKNCYPHASANVETRGESVFAAMNAIDGNVAAESHGNWPYESWGINRREDACWKLEFGRTVAADRVVIYLRADYPHDNWWEEGKITFSDGTSMIVKLEKGGHAQEFVFEEKKIEWLALSDLKKADDPSPFPALTQLEVYGMEVDF